MKKMKRIQWMCIAAAASLLTCSAIIPAQKKDNAEVLLQAAIQKETVDGDLRAAIDQYKKISVSTNRAIAAQALLHMAECYRKLGDSQSRKIYEQVLHDYSDQKDAVSLARTRLGGSAFANGIVTRQVWPQATTTVGRDMYGTVSPDGRYIPYVDWNKEGNLFVHDLMSGSDRAITNQATDEKDIYAENFSFSQDGKSLVYSWHTPEHYELRLAALEGSDVPQYRVLVDNPDVVYINPHDWTPDGKWITVSFTRKDHTAQIGLVSVSNGSLRVLKSVDWRMPERMFLSPDAKYLAFDTPANENTEQRDIFVIAIDGSREVPVLIHPANEHVMGWSRDGKFLLFASDRSGVTGLWAVAMSDGMPQGDPQLIKADLGDVESMGVTTSGALYFWDTPKLLPTMTVRLASFDFATGRFTSDPITIGGTGSQAPVWSRDGKYLNYVANRPGGNPVIVIRSTETGESRELHPAMRLRGPARWSPDGRSLLAGGRDFKGRVGVHIIDIQTGNTSPVSLEPDDNGGNPFLEHRPDWSPDGKTVYYKELDRRTMQISFLARDLASGNERELMKANSLGEIILSPDGRFIASAYTDSDRARVVVAIPTVGGQPREILRVRDPERITVPMWAPDSRSLFLNRITNGKNQPVRISLNGEVHNLDIDSDKYKFMIPPNAFATANPDGRRIAYTAVGEATPGSRYETEIWVMENFLPISSAKK